MTKQEFIQIQQKFPFLSYLSYLEEDYIGIIQNSDKQLLSFYDYNAIPSTNPDAKKLFLELGEEWWWESNRKQPINVFIKSRFELFKPILRTFARKDVDVHSGHIVSLQENMENRRFKKKNIKIVRRHR